MHLLEADDVPILKLSRLEGLFPLQGLDHTRFNFLKDIGQYKTAETVGSPRTPTSQRRIFSSESLSPHPIFFMMIGTKSSTFFSLLIYVYPTPLRVCDSASKYFKNKKIRSFLTMT